MGLKSTGNNTLRLQSFVGSLIERTRVFCGVFFTGVESMSTDRANRLEDRQELIFVYPGRSSANSHRILLQKNRFYSLVKRCHDVSIYRYLRSCTGCGHLPFSQQAKRLKGRNLRNGGRNCIFETFEKVLELEVLRCRIALLVQRSTSSTGVRRRTDRGLSSQTEDRQESQVAIL